jgi:hypothetical protein
LQKVALASLLLDWTAWFASAPATNRLWQRSASHPTSEFTATRVTIDGKPRNRLP